MKAPPFSPIVSATLATHATLVLDDSHRRARKTQYEICVACVALSLELPVGPAPSRLTKQTTARRTSGPTLFSWKGPRDD